MASKVGNLVLDLSTRLSLRTGAVSCKSFVGGGGAVLRGSFRNAKICVSLGQRIFHVCSLAFVRNLPLGRK